jgi:hypothetical protein
VYPPIIYVVGQAILDDRHKAAEHDALVRAAKRARKEQGVRPDHRGPSMRAALLRLAHVRTAPGC